MYCTSALESTQKKRQKYWHGTFGAQSPLFGKEYLHCGDENGKYVEIYCFEYDVLLVRFLQCFVALVISLNILIAGMLFS
jgi:hypothetical protein